jgi:hypothetical protein
MTVHCRRFLLPSQSGNAGFIQADGSGPAIPHFVGYAGSYFGPIGQKAGATPERANALLSLG